MVTGRVEGGRSLYCGCYCLYTVALPEKQLSQTDLLQQGFLQLLLQRFVKVSTADLVERERKWFIFKVM